jgi:hypothetical protein
MTEHTNGMQASVDPELVELANERDHELVDHLVSYKRLDPGSDVAGDCEELREAFKRAGHLLVNVAPRTLDRTVAIRKIHEAAMASIASLVLNS